MAFAISVSFARTAVSVAMPQHATDAYELPPRAETGGRARVPETVPVQIQGLKGLAETG